MQVGMTETQKARYNEFLGPIVEKNFTQRPSAGPAFAQMTYQLFDVPRLLGSSRTHHDMLEFWPRRKHPTIGAKARPWFQ